MLINSKKLERGTGWIRDLPDIRDYSVHSLKLLKSPPIIENSNRIVDLRNNCSPIRNQESIGSCTSHAVLGLFEYFQKKTYGDFTELSPLFLYKITRSLNGFYIDSGATIRWTFGALATIGVSPEKYWAYQIDWFNEEPGALQYAQAVSYKITSYYRLDKNNISPEMLLETIKILLENKIPIACGFSLLPSFYYADNTGIIPEPGNESVIAGHAIGIFGINYQNNTLIIRNSWGTNWGDKGYCYVPFSYVLNGLMSDFWIIWDAKWIDVKDFHTYS